MTDPYDPNPAPELRYEPVQPYSPPPFYGQPPPNQQPYQQPGYLLPPPPTPYTGYPSYPGYPGYLPPGSPDERPSSAVAAAVIGFVCGGLLIAAGLLLLMGASFVGALSTDLSNDDHNAIVWLGIAGAANIITAGLAIFGGILLLTRNPIGRSLLAVATAIDVICAIGWISQDAGSTFFFILLLTVPLVVATPLAWQRPVTTWLAAGNPVPPR